MEETKHIDRYYTTLENMLYRYDKHYREYGYKGDFKSVDEFERWRDGAKERLYALLGLERIFEDSECTLQSRLEERLEFEIFTREKVYLDVDRFVTIPMYVFLPNERSKGIWIALSGHQGAGKDSVAGLKDTLSLKEKTDEYEYDYGLSLAKSGYTVIVPDTRGYGERRERYMQGDEKDKYLRSSCRELQNIASSLGFTLTGLYVYDLIRIADYIYERFLPGDEGLGVIGFSGGAMQGLYFSPFDDRVKRLFLSGYFYGFRSSLIELNNNCSCNYSHGVLRAFDTEDLMMMSSPKNTVIQYSDMDHLNGKEGVENVLPQLETANKAWALYGKSLIVDSGYKSDHSFHQDRLLELIERL